MKRLFDLNSPLVVFLTKIADLMLLNILFLLSCIPVVTIGAAIVGLITSTASIYRGESPAITNSFFQNIKKKWSKATVIWLVFCLLAFFILVNFLMAKQFSTLFFKNSMRFFLYCVIVLSLFPLLYIFRMVAMTNLSLSEVVVESVKMSIKQLPLTVMLIVGVVLFILLVTFSSFFLRIVYGLFLTIGCSLLSLFMSKISSNFEDVPKNWE